MPACAPAWPGRSVRQGQADDGIIGDRGDGLKGHVAGALDGPLVVLLEEDGADQSGDCGLVGEDADDLGAPLDFAVEALDGIGAVKLGSMLLWKGHVRQHIAPASSIKLASFGTFGLI